MRIDLEGRLRFRAQAMCVSRLWQQEAVVRVPKQHGLLQGALWPTGGLRCTELRPTDVAPERPNPEMRIDLEGRLRFRAQAMCVSRRWQQEAVGRCAPAAWPAAGDFAPKWLPAPRHGSRPLAVL